MRFFLYLALAAATLILAGAAPASAQNVSGVSGADVKAGDDTIEYRAGFSPESDGKAASFAHRLSFQHAFDGSWRARVILLQSKRGAQALTTRSVNLEIQRQFLESERTGGWDSAIRIDGSIPTEAAPGRARIA